jgi:hypothetical protein
MHLESTQTWNRIKNENEKRQTAKKTMSHMRMRVSVAQDFPM